MKSRARFNPGGILTQAWERLQVMVVRSHGRRDGRRGYPNAADTQPPAEYHRIERGGNARLNSLAAAYALAAGVLGADYCARGHEIIERFKPGLDACGVVLSILQSRLARLETDLEQATRTMADAAIERWRVGGRVFKATILMLVTSDIVLNSVVFRVFGDNQLLTMITSIGLTAGLIFGAHVLGILYAQDEVTLRDRAFIYTITVTSTLACVLFGILREHYLKVAAPAGGSVQFMGQQIALPHIGSAHPLGPVLGPLVFTLANGIVFVAATVLSYLHHDPHSARVERLSQQIRPLRWRERLARWKFNWLLKRATQAYLEMTRLDVAHRALFAAYLRWINREQQRYQADWKSYASSNRRVRRVSEALPVLELSLALEVPEPFKTGAVPAFECDAVRIHIEQMLRARHLPTDPGPSTTPAPSLERGPA